MAGVVGLGPVIGRHAVLDVVGRSMSAQTDQRRDHLANAAVHDVQGGTAQAQAHLLLSTNAGATRTW